MDHEQDVVLFHGDDIQCTTRVVVSQDQPTNPGVVPDDLAEQGGRVRLPPAPRLRRDEHRAGDSDTISNVRLHQSAEVRPHEFCVKGVDEAAWRVAPARDLPDHQHR